MRAILAGAGRMTNGTRRQSESIPRSALTRLADRLKVRGPFGFVRGSGLGRTAFALATAPAARSYPWMDFLPGSLRWNRCAGRPAPRGELRTAGQRNESRPTTTERSALRTASAAANHDPVPAGGAALGHAAAIRAAARSDPGSHRPRLRIGPVHSRSRLRATRKRHRRLHRREARRRLRLGQRCPVAGADGDRTFGRATK